MAQRFEDIPLAVWVVPTAMLMLALAPLPYGYYTILRIVVCVAAGWLAVAGFQSVGENKNIAVGMLLIAVLYNPLLPVSLTREIWSVLNILGALAFAAHGYVFKYKKEEAEK